MPLLFYSTVHNHKVMPLLFQIKVMSLVGKKYKSTEKVNVKELKNDPRTGEIKGKRVKIKES